MNTIFIYTDQCLLSNSINSSPKCPFEHFSYYLFKNYPGSVFVV